MAPAGISVSFEILCAANADVIASVIAFLDRLAKEFDGDLWGNFADRLVNFVGGIDEPVRVDVDANAATRTLHVFTQFQSPDALFKFMAAVRTLKSDDVGIDIWHRASSVLFLWARETGAALRPTGSEQHVSPGRRPFCAAHQASERAKGGAFFRTLKPNRSCRRCGHPIEPNRARPICRLRPQSPAAGLVRRRFDLILISNAWIISIQILLNSSSWDPGRWFNSIITQPPSCFQRNGGR